MNFSSNQGYSVYENNVQYSSVFQLADVKILLSSKEAFRDNGLHLINESSKKVYDYINSEEAVRCDYGPYLGRGIPQICTPRNLTEAEREKAIAKAQEYFLEQKNILNENYADIYVALAETFPFDVFNNP